jgi:hypothetical protein
MENDPVLSGIDEFRCPGRAKQAAIPGTNDSIPRTKELQSLETS